MMGSRTALFLLIGAVVATGIVSLDTQGPPPPDLLQLPSGLRVMRQEVSIMEWRQCYDDGVCSHMPKPGRGAIDNDYPVTGVNAFDVEEFVSWAQQNYHMKLRLPTTDEWRGFAGFDNFSKKKLFSDPRMAWAADYGIDQKVNPTLQRPGYFGSNADGVADLHGNVWEWTASCARPEFDGKCPAYIVEGEHEAAISVFVRDPSQGGCATGTPPAHLGFRLVADL